MQGIQAELSARKGPAAFWVSDVQGGAAVAREASNERLAEHGT